MARSSSAVAVDGDVAEADHGAHGAGEVGGEETGLLEQVEGLAAFLGEAEAVLAREVHGQVDAGLAGALEVQDDRVLAGGVLQEVPVVAGVDLADAGEAALDDRRLVQDDVIGHGCGPPPGCARGSRGAPR